MRIGPRRYGGKLVQLGVVAIAGLMTASAAGLVYPGGNPGHARAAVENNALRLSNRVLDTQWQVHGTRLQPVLIRNRITDQTLPLHDCDGFALILADGTIARSADLQILEAPRAVPLAPANRAARLSERLPGVMITARLGAPEGRYDLDWQLILRDGANAARQQI
ncbi:MAG: hypothetical protein ACP5MD_04360, partial [Verrucomicrobiia bacterium]